MDSSRSRGIATFATHSVSTNEPVVSIDWLHANLREPNVKVFARYSYLFMVRELILMRPFRLIGLLLVMGT